MTRRWLALAVLAAAACNPEVRYQSAGGGSSDDCGPPPPTSGGWCPPAWACVDGEWVDQAGACPPPACPASEPSSGGSCDIIGQTCTYDTLVEYPCDGTFEEQRTYECTEDGWFAPYPYCQPPVECPAEPLVPGQDCSDLDYAYWCEYSVPTSCGDAELVASCEWQEGAYVWTVLSLEEPEACVDACAHETAAGCEASEACRWLTPGCDDGPNSAFEAGCFPAEPCTEGSCGEGEICTTFSHDPCFASSCEACASETTACQ